MPIKRALGVQWRIENDKFDCNVNVKLRPPTRRGIMSVVGTVFDPFGFAAPFVLTAKKILQDLCQVKLSFSGSKKSGGLLSLGSIPDADPEVKVDVYVHATAVAVPFCPVVEYFGRTCSWHGLKKSIAWFLRYRKNLRLASTRKKLAIFSPNAPWWCINMEEMKASELQILKFIQLHYFPDELQSLAKAGVDGAHVKKTSGLRSLDPVLVNGLLRVGGRLGLVPASFDFKYQIILPKSDHVSTLIIEHCHLVSGHSGREFVLSLLREKIGSLGQALQLGESYQSA